MSEETRAVAEIFANEWFNEELEFIEKCYRSGELNGELADIAVQWAYEQYRELMRKTEEE
jgi:hypothetical protein